MKNKKRWLLIGVAILIAGLLIGSKVYMDKQQEAKVRKEKMIEIVKSEEAKKEFEVVLTNLDSKALTSDGKINTYSISNDTIRKNLMGGINVVLVINDDANLTIEYTLNMINGHLEAGGVSYSGSLANLLEQNHNE
ncbi:DUF1310 family protein [Listeria welshimeri]|uniref:Uncharacterized protein n=1 Tax=Listeria welshimeri serovar 6b (strain ATCC 35897 / DSM 20650 / CCUG 15529 / CIP 8149 / NCTC 11857 / SLCC 5334 / V8) TaxID=386043 RepID=A0AL47_LISW6|nr:DUF1310 family protein [Listeria welshimeri]MBC1610804.1 DUF1310 family protein [Listeria welshimeri]MBF2387520.1 DUF1310 family protein [Listeria welshimeri]CAK21729.1 hypothetical protein lwe2311 [Listeria welshimeri serovar 6b str. SLCC5334]SNV28498.1 Protein of uncharacterised function (DUF1310) [Listeria welshimeri]